MPIFLSSPSTDPCVETIVVQDDPQLLGHTTQLVGAQTVQNKSLEKTSRKVQLGDFPDLLTESHVMALNKTVHSLATLIKCLG